MNRWRRYRDEEEDLFSHHEAFKGSEKEKHLYLYK